MESTNDEESSHKVVVERAKKLLSELLTDPFLSDISSTASHDEVSSQLALEQGRAVTVHVRRFDDQVLSVIVLQGATVGDLMCAIQRLVIKKLSLAGRTTPIRDLCGGGSLYPLGRHCSAIEKPTSQFGYRESLGGAFCQETVSQEIVQ